MSGDEPAGTGAGGAGGRSAGEDLTGVELARAALRAAREAARRRAGARSRDAERRRVAGERAASRAGGHGGRRGTGRRGGYSGAGADPRDPQPLGALVRRLVEDRGWQHTAAAAGVLARWPDLVGADVASHCRPVSLRAGELVVEAESTAWATQLRLLAPRLLARLDAELGRGLVRRVRVNGPAAPSWRRGPLRVTGPGPRDTYG